MDTKRIKFHVEEIAGKHKRFIKFLREHVESNPGTYPPNDFAIWLVFASYFCAIHLLEAIFAGLDKPATDDADHNAANSRRLGRLREPGFGEVRKEFKSLQRLAFRAENFSKYKIVDYQ